MCTVKEMEMNNLLGLHRWQTCIDFDEYESLSPHVSDSGTVKNFAAIGVTSWAGWSKKNGDEELDCWR